jgi:hypothetical protein
LGRRDDNPAAFYRRCRDSTEDSGAQIINISSHAEPFPAGLRLKVCLYRQRCRRVTTNIRAAILQRLLVTPGFRE